ncbi:MAG: preprotein translocase subunit SecD, partial [Rubrivivax sp.]
MLADAEGQSYPVRMQVELGGDRLSDASAGFDSQTGEPVVNFRFDSVQEAGTLSALLRAGALPAKLTIVEERTVGPSLGSDSIRAGLIASAIGLVLVLIFMVVGYGLFGIFANIALLVNLLALIALMSFFGFT